MHCADTLFANMFEIEKDGAPASTADIFPDWQPHDRFGILIDEPLGALGATHLIQVAIAAFYDARPERRTERRVYPEIYAIHIGEDFGALTEFDFWPARREVIVSTDHREILDAINDRAITRLALPYTRPSRTLEHRPKEPDAALELLRSAILYSADGRLENPDFSITGLGRGTETNTRKVIRPPHLSEETVKMMKESGSMSKETDKDYTKVINSRFSVVSDELRAAATSRRKDLSEEKGVRETYRIITPEEALTRL
ncbi:hypothetical protein [Tianweitania sp.]|uniref:hypothetical protein n=1 Tax=Tianweitania sp. TaxID=2021634 RepID=UPI002899B974|nr:hypothetical protein [Tianweitania sp.]